MRNLDRATHFIVVLEGPAGAQYYRTLGCAWPSTLGAGLDIMGIEFGILPAQDRLILIERGELEKINKRMKEKQNG
tara:strand:- start:383 stop:610 length:228 start_codon:yes stop_codon:yes gene_type:complete